MDGYRLILKNPLSLLLIYASTPLRNNLFKAIRAADSAVM